MHPTTTPLRYPGGKQILTNVLAELLRLNRLDGGTYAEPYAGGAGAALALLFSERVDRIMINDADPCMFAFWKSVLDDTDSFVALLRKKRASIAEWRRQKAIYRDHQNHTSLEVGFATFFLNRCNRSGIIASGGPIGGYDQSGPWKVDARYNPKNLEQRVLRIAEYGPRIALSNHDALKFLRSISKVAKKENVFVYLDPPYYVKGRQLYLNYYEPKDHAALAQVLRADTTFDWVLTYDNAPEIRQLYAGLRQVDFDLSYSARERRTGSEILIVKPGLRLPKDWAPQIPSEWITSSRRAA